MTTAADRVRVARRVLVGSAIASAVAWGIAAAAGLLAVLSFASLGLPELVLHRGASRALSLLAGVLVTLAILWRARHVRSLQRVALWIEERIPELEYALVTVVEQGGAPHASELEAHVARYDIAPVARGVVRRSLTPAIAAAVVAVALLHAASSATTTGSALARAGGTRGAGATRGSRIAPLEVQVTPPSYAGLHSSTLDDPSSVRALMGSRVSVRGPGNAAGLDVMLGSAAMHVSSSDRGWSVALEMPRQSAALRLRDGADERILVLEPRPDEPPRVVLTTPQHDSTLRIASGVRQLTATASDDIGLSVGHFEYLVTSGSGEVFKARTIEMPATAFGGARSGSLSATLDLGTLGLKQGDVLSIRAIARDVNSESGPGEAVSDTRTFRIARADEYDSVAVEAAGPTEGDSSTILDRARITNRLYLRGAPPKVVVDLARVRMTGKEKGRGSTRTPLGPVDSARASLEGRFDDALDLLPGRSREAVRALALLQVDALASAPSFGAALGEAIDAFHRGGDATLPLLRARRALFGEPVAAGGLSSWSGAW